jgi:autotransporter-associated beta strand protein
MKKHTNIYIFGAICLFNLLFTFSSVAVDSGPDFRIAGTIAALKADPKYSSSPYGETYNLGATGLRGWIYDNGNRRDSEVLSLTTEWSRQILITVASAPGNAVLAVDDVILGAMAGSTGTVPEFASDSRKAIGAAISNAEKTGAGTLRVKRWREGISTDVNIAMTIMGNYSVTAPYNCPKSKQVLAAARTKLVAELLADPSFLTNGFYPVTAGINGLALMAGVVPGDANYEIVQARLQSYARAVASANLYSGGYPTWTWAYTNIFLSEYYLRSVEAGLPDAIVLAGINKYTVAMAKAQSRYGTFGHDGSSLKADGSLHGTITGYGAINAAGISANLSILLGKKALLAGSQALDPEIDPAIERGSNFIKYYMNKGSISYAENEPQVDHHSFNGKEQMTAIFFALQGNRPVETEYFSRLSTAGYLGRETGHSGTGFNYMWEAIGANVGGPTAVAKYLEKVLWNLDLERRTDGSFVYDGMQAKVEGGSTEDGTYLGKSSYQNINSTAYYVLTYSLPLQRLYITGKNANPSNTLDAAKVANAIAAGSYKLDCPAYSNTRLIADFDQFDPIVREHAATELGTRTSTLTTAEKDTLIAMVNSANVKERVGACRTLGILKIPAAVPLLTERLSDLDLWVRAKAANALRSFRPQDFMSQLTPMLNAFITNATDPEVIAWEDPSQIANTFLSSALFGDSVDGKDYKDISRYTILAPKDLLYPALRVGLKQPYSYPRTSVAIFTNNLTLADVQALTPELFATATTPATGGTMWQAAARGAALTTLAKFKAAEAIPLALTMTEALPGFDWGSAEHRIPALDSLILYGDAARWTLPGLRAQSSTSHSNSRVLAKLADAVASIDSAIISPAGINNLMAVANPQLVVTKGAKEIILTGSSCRSTTVNFSNADVTRPAHGELTGTAPNLKYTPNANYIGPDFFTFKTRDALTTSASATVSIIVGVAGNGLKGEYFDNPDFTNLKLTRIDPEVNFDWGTGSPSNLIAGDSFSVCWSGQLLVPETGNYTFSTLNSDGVRLFINGVSLIDDYVDQSTGWKDSVPIRLTAGEKVSLQMEYYENTGLAVAKLKWTGPSLAGLNGLPIAKEWLYDGKGLTTRTAYAHAQSVSMIQNTVQAVTLKGSGAGQSHLAYSIVNPPTHGTLIPSASGSPNFIYEPSKNFSGSDSFTFTVNYGSDVSTPATVSIGIWAGLPNSYFWSNAVAGNWSGSFWTNAAGDSVRPAAAGNSTYILNFDKSGTYITIQDLNNNYLFNQLNLTGTVTFAGPNSLSPTANGPLLPQINQNSGNPVTFSAPINLAATTSFGGVGGGSIAMTGVISGTGGVNKDSPGTLQIYGLTPNPYSGGTIVNAGTLHLGGFIGSSSINCINPVGTGPVTLNSGGTIEFEKVSTNNALIANGGTLYTPNGWGATWSGAISLNGTVTVNATYGPLTCSGAISGAGGFIKVAGGTLLLTGTNDFTGANRITAGTLQCNSASSLGTGTLDITLGVKVNLNFTGTRTIAALTFNGGAPLAPGTYGSTTSPATSQNNTYFSGNGTITILPVSATSINLSTDSNPSILGKILTFTATVTGSAPSGNVAFYDGAVILGSSNLNGSFKASFTTSRLAIGAHSITAKYIGNVSHAPSRSAELIQVILLDGYKTWVTDDRLGLTVGVNDSSSADPDGDGISNLLEFALCGAPMISSQAVLPTLKKSVGGMLFEYNRSDVSLSTTTQVVEYGSDLSGWISVIIPAISTGIVGITPGSLSDRVSVTIPNSGNRLFVRLKVSQ